MEGPGAVKACGVLVLFEGAEVRCIPIPDDASGFDLGERLAQFCKAVLEDPDLANCVVGLHGHTPGDCARRADGAGS